MSSELREALVIGIELILFSLLIIIVAFFGDYSQDAFRTQKNQQDATRAIESYSSMYEFTSGAEIDYDFIIEELGIKRTETGSYRNLTDSNILLIYNNATNKSFSSLDKIPEFYLVTGDDIARFAGLNNAKYDIVITNLDNKEYKTLVFTDMESANGKGDKFTTPSHDDIYLGKFASLVGDNNSNINKENANYMQINELLGEEIVDSFYCIGIYDKYYNTYDSVLFYKVKG